MNGKQRVSKVTLESAGGVTRGRSVKMWQSWIVGVNPCFSVKRSNLSWLMILFCVSVLLIFVGSAKAQEKLVDVPSPSLPVVGSDNDLALEVVPPPDSTSIIDLSTALRLAETQNPKIALAREQVLEAMALHKEARAIWLPTLTAGSNYHLHTGVLQTSFGQIRQINEQSIYFGGGSRSLAAESVAIPAVRIFAQLSDAYYLPLAAGQMVTARAYDSNAIDNLTLMEVADRYLTLVAAEARRESLQVSLKEVEEVEQAQKVFASAGQGRDADYRRAKSDRLLMQLEEQQAQEEVAIASAELSRLLHLDPSVRLLTPAGPIEMLQLVDESSDVEALVVQGMYQRPEVAARSAEIGAAEYRVRNERYRAWLPLISVGFSGAAFGGGSNRQDLGVPSTYYMTAGRTDFDVWAVWNVQNLGAGNRAWQGIRLAEREQVVVMRALILAEIRREVEERLARVRASSRAVTVSWKQLSAAERGAQEELLRTRAGEALPLESLNSVLRLSNARQQLLTSVIEYNRAQVKLFVALGTNPSRMSDAIDGVAASSVLGISP